MLAVWAGVGTQAARCLVFVLVLAVFVVDVFVIFDWVRFADESWEGMARRMKGRLGAALLNYPVDDRSEVCNKRLESMLTSLTCASAPALAFESYYGVPILSGGTHDGHRPYRARRKPRQGWH